MLFTNEHWARIKAKPGEKEMLEKILMTADTVGGVWTYSMELIRSLQSREVKVYLATMGAPLSASQKEEVQQLSNLELFPSNYRLEWMENPWSDVDAAGNWLWDLCEKIQPDLLHFNHYAHGHLPWRVPSVVVGHSCVLSWWEAVKGESAPSSWQEYARRVTRGIQGADFVVGVSSAMMNSLQKFYGPFAGEKTAVIYNGCNPQHFTRIPMPLKHSKILALGRVWDLGKNFQILEKVARHHSFSLVYPWEIQIAGDLQQPDKKEGNKDGVNFSHVTLLGTLSRKEVREKLSQAAICVVPSLYEPFGLVPVEAALSGCTLVLSKIPSFLEIWEGAAHFFDPQGDEGEYELREILSTLMENPGRREEWAQRAYARALELSHTQMEKSYWDQYLQLIKKNSIHSSLREGKV